MKKWIAVLASARCGTRYFIRLRQQPDRRGRR